MQKPKNISGVLVFPHSLTSPVSFDLRITKAEAERLLTQYGEKLPFDIMCKEYGDDDDWAGLSPEDIDPATQRLGDEYESFEIWYAEVPPAPNQLTLL